MVRSVSADELLRSARRAAGTHNVREAVRDLTLHALRSHLLTATHIAAVARTVGEGIESSDVPATAPVRETHREAWAGLQDALDQALRAVELAAREFAEGRAQLTQGEREQMLAEIAQMERSLGEGKDHARIVPAYLKARIDSMMRLLRQAVAQDSKESALGAEKVLSFVSSGVLLGLSEGLRNRPEGTAR